MANMEYVPPTIYGPTPVDPDELEREAGELVAQIQQAADEHTATAPAVDPWELLRELVRRFDAYCKPPDGNKGLAWFHLCSGIKQLEEELKQHDAERKSDGK